MCMTNIKVGSIIDAKITGITGYGFFVEAENGYTGLLHISQITDRFVDDIQRIYVIGEIISAKVIEIDEEKKQLRLSTKEFNDKKNRKKSIKEEGRGFAPLRENLDKWVNEKLNELKNLDKSE